MNKNAKTWPHAWSRRYVKWAALEYANKILGRLDDDNGTIMKIRQQLAKESAMMLAGNSHLNNESDFTTPVPQWVAEDLLLVFWHRDFKLTVNEDEVVKTTRPENM